MLTARRGSRGAPDLHQVCERHALEQLHDQVIHAAVGDVEVEHLHDVRMPQGRGYLRLLPKPGERLAIPGEAGSEHLDRERPRQARVGRKVDLAASPLRERAHDPIRLLQDRTGREGPDRRCGDCPSCPMSRFRTSLRAVSQCRRRALRLPARCRALLDAPSGNPCHSRR